MKASINFYLRYSNKVTGKSIIHCHLRVNGEKHRFSLGLFVFTNSWDKEKMKVLDTDSTFHDINNLLDKYKGNLNNLKISCLKDNVELDLLEFKSILFESNSKIEYNQNLQRRCSKCNEIKSHSEFRSKIFYKKGEGVIIKPSSWCISCIRNCDKIYRDENKEIRNSKKRKYYSDNKNYIKANINIKRKESRTSLDDSYLKKLIKRSININSVDISQEQLELKRAVLNLQRVIKKQQKNETNKS